MSEAKPLHDLLKSLPSITDLTGQKALLSDALGALGKSSASVLGITYSRSNGYGASLLGSSQKGYALVIAFDTADRSKALAYIISKPEVAVVGTISVLHSAGGLEVNATNNQGTVALKGYTSYEVVVQHVLKFS